MTAISTGNPVRTVELREADWNTLLEQLQYSQIGAVSNVVHAVQAQLAEPFAETDETPGYTVFLPDNDGSHTRIEFPTGYELLHDEDVLYVRDRAGVELGAFADGRWGYAQRTPATTKEILDGPIERPADDPARSLTKEASDDRAASSS